MKCIEARRMVTPFVKKELSDKEIEQFLKHIEQCEDCKDELDIYFTMYKAIELLDSGAHQEFDFKKKLEEELRASRRMITVHHTTRIVRSAAVLLAELVLIFCVYTGVEMRCGETEYNAFQKALERFHEIAFEKEAYPAEPLEQMEVISMREMMRKLAENSQIEESETEKEETAS